MKSGRLRHRGRIERKTAPTSNAFNEPIVQWQSIGEVWADVEPLTGREFFANAQVQGEITHRVTMRYMPGVGPSNRFVFIDPRPDGSIAERAFDIKQVIDPRERHVELQLMCVERV
jgi:SPP1 family predicted phage head-tail adaptor